MRETQYIGLNQYAQDYVKDAIKTETFEMTQGMFGEPVHGTIYHMPTPKGPNKEYRLVETVQAEPWSSGPIIFTCLKGILVKESGQELDTGEYFQWMLDPSIENEFDHETGRYYV